MRRCPVMMKGGIPQSSRAGGRKCSPGPEETGSNQGWALQVTYGQSLGDMGSHQKMRLGRRSKNRMERDWDKKIIQIEKCGQNDDGACVLTSNVTGGRERKEPSVCVTRFVLKGQSRASDLKLKWNGALAPLPHPQLIVESITPPAHTLCPYFPPFHKLHVCVSYGSVLSKYQLLQQRRRLCVGQENV